MYLVEGKINKLLLLPLLLLLLLLVLMSKSKFAPIKTTTVPRLELNDAAVMAVRMYRVLVHELDLPIHKSYLWTDSMLVLQYIRNCTKRFKIFVANRVTEILEVSRKEQWNFVLGEQNPADLITRGVSDPEKLMERINLENVG